MDEDSLTQLTPVAALRDCAVVVIDMQNDFLSKGGVFDLMGYNIAPMRRIVPRLAEFLGQVRVLGGNIIYFRHIHDRRQYSRMMLDRSRRLYGTEDGFPLLDTWGAEICPSVGPLDGELVLDKHWYNAFSNPEFEATLKKLKVRTLVLTGVMTHVCVETTARAANTHDFYTVVVEDCVAGDSDELHDAAIKNLRAYFGWVCSANELLTLWHSR